MTKIGMLFACVLVACGGSNGSKAQQPVAQAAPEPMPASDPADYEAAAPEPVEEPAPEPMPAPAPEPVAAAPVTATAELMAIKDDAPMGTLRFEMGEGGQVTITGEFTGLKKKSAHALYIHEKGDCGKKGKAAGAHLNPTKAKHGPPSSSVRHAGDFGDLVADDAGNATFTMVTDSVTMEPERPDSVLDRAVIIHSKKDDKKGDGGPALACGVVKLTDPASAETAANP